MTQSGSEITEIRTLATHSEELLSGLRSCADQTNQQHKIDLEQFGSEAVELIDHVATQIASELAETLEVERERFQKECAEWDVVRVEVETELAEREQNLAQRADTSELEKRCNALEEAAEQLRQELSAGEEVNTQVTARSSDFENERNDLQQKFDLALQDLQQHRDHVAQLEESLAARPDVEESESQELVQLRNERDELMARLDELSIQAAHATESDDVADLRARFEMAVDEVRQLKTEKTDLEQRLANAPAATSAPVIEGDDWESQKRRMLAMLEGEGEADSPERNEERASINGTIQITDGVVQEKDRKIAELEEQVTLLESQESAFTPETIVDEATVALLDDDEVIGIERERLAQLESELQEKLRAAEIELSVERAKIARAQAEIIKQQDEMTVAPSIGSSNKGTSSATEGKRKWFKKMGLGDDIKE